jgi:hypothetical protein
VFDMKANRWHTPTHLGTAERVADLVKDHTAPIPPTATGAVWLAAQWSGVF